MPELGEGSLPSPKQEPPRAPASKQECEDKAALMNLGARSHSGNSPEADAEVGGLPLPMDDNHRAEKTERDHWVFAFGLNGSFLPI